MTFEQMVDTWHSQEEAPLYGINRDLLQLVLRHEEADLRRSLRREHWTIYAASVPLFAFAALCVWAFIYYDGPLWGLATAAGATALLMAGAGALSLSRRHQALRERSFGNSLRDEIGRNLSLVDYELSRKGRTERTLAAGAPIILAAVLLNWLAAGINDNTEWWFVATITFVMVVAWVSKARRQSRTANAELLPRRQRLNELLELLDPSE